MAYSATVSYQPSLMGGRRFLLVTISETEGAATSETSADIGRYLLSGHWKIVRVKQVLTAGSAATVAPVFGTATNPTSGTLAYVGGLGAAASQDSTNSGAGWVGAGQTLYHRSVPNAGADNSISTQYYLAEGWF